jgi:hypothetical protein
MMLGGICQDTVVVSSSLLPSMIKIKVISVLLGTSSLSIFNVSEHLGMTLYLKILKYFGVFWLLLHLRSFLYSSGTHPNNRQAVFIMSRLCRSTFA